MRREGKVRRGLPEDKTLFRTGASGYYDNNADFPSSISQKSTCSDGALLELLLRASLYTQIQVKLAAVIVSLFLEAPKINLKLACSFSRQSPVVSQGKMTGCYND